jgi:hypothetical protein
MHTTTGTSSTQQQPACRTWQNNSAGSDDRVGADLAALLDHRPLADQTAVAHGAGGQQRAVADGHLQADM